MQGVSARDIRGLSCTQQDASALAAFSQQTHRIPRLPVTPVMADRLLAWFMVSQTMSLLSLASPSQAQPDPKRPAARALNCSRIASTDPKSSSIFFFRSPPGPLVSLGRHMIFQKKLWFQCPPALSRRSFSTSPGRSPVPTLRTMSSRLQSLSDEDWSTPLLTKDT